jgi:hypothetical protein
MFAPNADGHRRQRGLKEDAIRYSNADAKAAGFTAGLRADDECSPSTKRNEEMQDGWLRMKVLKSYSAVFFFASAFWPFSPLLKRHLRCLDSKHMEEELSTIHNLTYMHWRCGTGSSRS